MVSLCLRGFSLSNLASFQRHAGVGLIGVFKLPIDVNGCLSFCVNLSNFPINPTY